MKCKNVVCVTVGGFFSVAVIKRSSLSCKGFVPCCLILFTSGAALTTVRKMTFTFYVNLFFFLVSESYENVK